ncbi:MAG: gliding motility-associated C-terminal domain-containing protein [Bacteroidales bacterium]|nr:gliding motility-associated C-terminal domain-containing protein [Bacteroidales bacterium]
MKHTPHIIRLLVAACLLLTTGSLRAQIGPHDPSDPVDCADFQWPVHQEPCPEVQIKQKHDHTPLKQYRAQGWDTVVTCSQHTLTLSCMPYVPAKYFNGQYTVDTIPYFPPDPTFALGTKMPVTTDDDFATEVTHIPFPFYFFGILKTAFVLGANGLITFDTTAVGKYCPWSFSHVLPWPNNTTGAPNAMGCTIANMRDAIYGVYEDTHPIAAYLHGNQGIYYGIQGEYPCRKIICSWNGIPTFPGTRNQNNRCTYQIVCYEGSNIIEVHVKRRGINTAWQNGRGLIGIQNATGTDQVRGNPGEPNMYVPSTGAPAAFYPAGANLLTTTLDSFAVRFTPQGETPKNYRWWRVFDDGRPSVELTTDPNDPNGFFTPMGEELYTCPNLTTAMVTPTETSRYVFQLIFTDASNHVYDLRDTIVIGMDTSHALTLRPASGTPADHQMDICSGLHANLIVEYPPQQDTVHTIRSIERIIDGDTVPLPDSMLVFGELYEDEITTLKRIPAIVLPDSTAANLSPGQIDSILITLSADFTSGGDCPATVTFLLRTFPSYDTTEHYGICRGDTLTWHLDGVNYTNSTTSPKVVLPTVANCDSVVHLNLKVYDLSYTVDHIFDCKPITWQNGHTYSEDNTATAATDTVVLKNVADCDSIVQLDFTIKPMTPRIEADREFFDLNHLDVVLNDVSTGGISRTWYFPTGNPQTAATAYYTIPYHLDSATIALVELSPYGCIDTAYITLPFRKDVVWVPNVFTPGSPSNENNSLFGSISNHLIKEETLIYNRRGELVFKCNEIDCTWDGTDLSGAPCPQGSYVYVIRYITEYDPRTTQLLKGSVTLLR